MVERQFTKVKAIRIKADVIKVVLFGSEYGWNTTTHYFDTIQEALVFVEINT